MIGLGGCHFGAPRCRRDTNDDTLTFSIQNLPLWANFAGKRTFDAGRVESGSRKIIRGRAQLFDDVGRNARAVELDCLIVRSGVLAIVDLVSCQVL